MHHVRFRFDLAAGGTDNHLLLVNLRPTVCGIAGCVVCTVCSV